ncbi:MAG: MATE family efflux transporter [Candidatus Omnitrophica bacterium]|nr:MATE family efflux transporter [Candidatus Omnitrophota bacterium]
MNSSKPAQGGMREVIGVALPMMVSHACDTVMTFTDRMFLSRLGPDLMNASMAGGLSAYMMMAFFLGLTGYATAVIAQNLGAGRKDRCSITLSQAVLIACVAYPILLLCRPLMHSLFEATGIGAAQLAPQKLYFNILLSAVILSLLRQCLSSFFSGIGRTRIVMLASLVTLLVNVGVNYLLIFGKLGFPALGIQGAAYGTITGTVCGLAILLSSYLSAANRREFGIDRSLRFDSQVMRTLLRFGYPAGVEMFLNLLAFTLIVLLFHSAGEVSATAATLMFNWDMVSFVPLIGVEIGVTSLVGRYMGARDPETAHRATMSGLKVGWMYSLVILLFFVCFPGLLVDLFHTSDAGGVFARARPTAVFMVRTASLYVMVEAVLVVFIGALRGAGDTFWTMCYSVTLHWILAPVVFVMLKVVGASPEAAWVALVLSFLLLTIPLILRYLGGSWKTIRMLPGETEAVAATAAIIPDTFHEPPDL